MHVYSNSPVMVCVCAYMLYGNCKLIQQRLRLVNVQISRVWFMILGCLWYEICTLYMKAPDLIILVGLRYFTIAVIVQRQTV